MGPRGPPKSSFWSQKMAFSRFPVSGHCRGSGGGGCNPYLKTSFKLDRVFSSSASRGAPHWVTTLKQGRNKVYTTTTTVETLIFSFLGSEAFMVYTLVSGPAVYQQLTCGVVREGVIAENSLQISAKFLRTFRIISAPFPDAIKRILCKFPRISAEFPQTFRKKPFANDPTSELLSAYHPFPLFSQENGVHHSFLCSMTSGPPGALPEEIYDHFLGRFKQGVSKQRVTTLRGDRDDSTDTALKAQRLKKFKISKFSSEIENFKRVAH